MLIKTLSRKQLERMRGRFNRLYGPKTADRCIERLSALCGRYGVGYNVPPAPTPWDETDAVLITYANSLRRDGEKPLVSLRRFVEQHLEPLFSTLHLLPFFPWSSDDGFSVIDYRQVAPDYGNWSDIEQLSQHARLMFDLVLNHVSRSSTWFKQYAAGFAPYRDYFIEADPDADWSAVVRPRSLPLLTEVHSHDGPRHLWTTFSEDQIDLNFANPDVLFEFLDILLFYIAKGASILRLDAVAFLWKQPGTSCVHLEQTHEVIKLFRDLLELIAPDVLLLTETNVPHEENITYFGNGDEAHMVYQFTLPPLLLHALRRQETQHLHRWAAQLDDPPPGCTWFNFTASHDGIGLRPLGGWIPQKEVDSLVGEIGSLGGKISTRRDQDGRDVPYEINCTYYDALGGDAHQEARFLCSQTVLLGLKGIPALYLHSLTATPNDLEGVEKTGRARSINRKIWTADELENLIARDTPCSRIFHALLERLRIRRKHKAFHPNAPQKILDLGDALFGFVRGAAPDEPIACIHNVTTKAQVVPSSHHIPGIDDPSPCTDLLTGTRYDGSKKEIRLDPYQSVWLSTRAP